VLPLQVAFPSKASVLLGIGVEFEDQILIECFANCLSHVEADQCLQIKGESFSDTICAKLVENFDRFGARETPTPSKRKTRQILRGHGITLLIFILKHAYCFGLKISQTCIAKLSNCTCLFFISYCNF